MTDELTALFENSFTVRENDIGSYANVKKSGMDFKIRSFKADGVGRFSTLTMSAMFGLMKMETFIFTPANLDAPLFPMMR